MQFNSESSTSDQHIYSMPHDDIDLEPCHNTSFNLAQTPPPSFSTPVTTTKTTYVPTQQPHKPDYESMSVPELKKLMAQYGMKSGSKAFMIEHLSRVWCATVNVPYTSTPMGLASQGPTESFMPPCDTSIVEDCIVKYIRQQSIYEEILQYKEIDFVDLMEVVKKSGVKCNKKLVQELLDKQGVSYTTKSMVNGKSNKWH